MSGQQSSLKIKSELLKCDDHVSDIFTQLHKFQEQEEFCDITLIAGTDKVKAHRIVLSATSGYFLKLFRDNSNTTQKNFSDINGRILKLIVNFMYTAEIEISSDTFGDIFKAVHILQMDKLIGLCYDFIEEKLDINNCTGIALLANSYSYKELYLKSIAYQFKYCNAFEDFLQISDDYLKQILSTSIWTARTQKNVLSRLKAWVEHDKENREKSIYDLLSSVRFELLTPDQIIQMSKHLCNTIECHELTRSWLEWHYLPKSSSSATPERIGTKSIKTINKLYFISGAFANHLQIQIYNQDLNRWAYNKKCLNVKKSGSDFGLTMIDEELIIVGGGAPRLTENTVECVNLRTMESVTLHPMKFKLCDPGVIEFNGRLSIVGGTYKGFYERGFDEYCFVERWWFNNKPLTECLSNIQLAVLDGLLYAAGDNHPFLMCYNPKIKEWTQKTFKNEKSINFGLTAVNGYLYLVGGRCGNEASKTVERYDPSNDSWSLVSPLSRGRSAPKCAALNNRLIVCGGFDDEKEWIDLTEEYNPKTDEWKTLAPLLPITSKRYYGLFAT